ncbi:MAG: phosphoribosyltransferase [Clostridia bacterium]|jgi:ComF family protein|nr:phosphoribosyltransferase [Clostridia bacterium]
MIGQYLKKLIYPDKCIVCRTLLEEENAGYLCDKCYSFVLRNHLCPKCGRPYNIGGKDCAYCKAEDAGDITQIIALFPYKDHFRKSVLRWKYSGLRKYARGYADVFVTDLYALDKLSIEGLVPVPISEARKRKRGFNQALDLAEEISKLTGVKVYDVLKRTKETKPQSKCTKKERLSNLKGSIGIKKDSESLSLNNIAIIDDIYTTGATVRECISVIKRQEVLKSAKIYVLTVCIGI